MEKELRGRGRQWQARPPPLRAPAGMLGGGRAGRADRAPPSQGWAREAASGVSACLVLCPASPPSQWAAHMQWSHTNEMNRLLSMLTSSATVKKGRTTCATAPVYQRLQRTPENFGTSPKLGYEIRHVSRNPTRLNVSSGSWAIIGEEHTNDPPISAPVPCSHE